MSRRLARVDELAVPAVVGAFYLVPMVFAAWIKGPARWLPVIGPKHDDRKLIGFPPTHYHVDGRFLTDRQWAWVDRSCGARGAAKTIAAVPICEGTPSLNEGGIPAPVYRRGKCRRLTTGFAALPPREFAFARLEAAFAGACAKGEPGQWICPHKGVPLSSLPVGEDGAIVCPLHGLAWRADSGLPAWPTAARR